MTDPIPSPSLPALLTDDEIFDMVGEVGLDWHRGFTLADTVNRYETLARVVEAAVLARSIPAPSAPTVPPELVWLYTHCAVLGMTKKSASGKWEHDIALFVCDLQSAAAAPTAAPIDMVLHCQKCGMQHIDKPEDPMCDENQPRPTPDHWDNPPHKSHLCHGCGHIWRPADVPTNGVADTKTHGKDDSPTAATAARDATIPSSVWLNDTGTAQKLSFTPLLGAYEHFEYRHARRYLDEEETRLKQERNHG